MMKLMKLELQKFNILRYWIAFAVINVSIIGLAVVTGTVADTEDAFGTAAQLLDFGDIMIRVTFIIFAGVLIAKVIIGEYKNSTMGLMFTYPIPRKKIMASKLAVVFLFTFFATILANLIFGFGMVLLNQSFHLIPDMIMIRDIVSRVPSMIFNGFACAGLGLISLFFGMRKYSISATIVSSIIVAILLNSSSGVEMNTLFSITVIPVIFCIGGIIIAYLSFANINKADIK